MKKVEKFKLSMTMAVRFIVALFATSCSILPHGKL
jgi:hypothetical protein